MNPARMLAWAVSVAWAAQGCATTAAGSPSPQSAMTQVMASPAARDVARDAPEAYAELASTVAEVEAGRAPPEDAQLTYAWALTQARVAEARARLADAERRRVEADADTHRMDDEAARLGAEVTRLTEAQAAAERARTAAATPVSVPRPERAAAATDLVQEAGLMLSAAELLGAAPEARRPVEGRIAAATQALGAHGDVNAAFLAAGGAYTVAEHLLRTTRASLASAEHPTNATVLTQELSGAGGQEPHVDERGVVSVMRGLFEGNAVAATARSRVESLARVIQGHADAQVSLEVWVGGPARAPAEVRARAEGESLTAALVRAGVPQARIHTEALYRAPGGARTDDRVEAVLVLPAEP